MGNYKHDKKGSENTFGYAWGDSSKLEEIIQYSI